MSSSLSVDDLVKYYISSVEGTGTKAEEQESSSQSSSSISKTCLRVGDKAAVSHPPKKPIVALAASNPNYDDSVHCMNCQSRKLKKECAFKYDIVGGCLFLSVITIIISFLLSCRCCYHCCTYSEMTSSKRIECAIHSAEYDKKQGTVQYQAISCYLLSHTNCYYINNTNLL